NPTSSKFIHTWLRFGEIMRGSLSAEQLIQGLEKLRWLIGCLEYFYLLCTSTNIATIMKTGIAIYNHIDSLIQY
ncbi:hypothetical protein, partial [Escherichia coli]|uniref:hypothetical protein n=1 Tax=Escherichia coli TaxID=562 RepID=UPI001BC84363